MSGYPGEAVVLTMRDWITIGAIADRHGVTAADVAEAVLRLVRSRDDDQRLASAPCSGRRDDDGSCFTCGHAVTDHNAELVCQVCDVPDTFVCSQQDSDEPS